jgi:hypothetical protein
MNKQLPTTKEVFDQLGTNRPFVEGRGRLDPYTAEELIQHEQDTIRATAEEAARWAANTVLLAERKRQAANHLAQVIPITEAPSYTAPLSGDQAEKIRRPQVR